VIVLWNRGIEERRKGKSSALYWLFFACTPNSIIRCCGTIPASYLSVMSTMSFATASARCRPNNYAQSSMFSLRLTNCSFIRRRPNRLLQGR
jgi:hypothetical protein